jgi:hypothetical protein
MFGGVISIISHNLHVLVVKISSSGHASSNNLDPGSLGAGSSTISCNGRRVWDIFRSILKKKDPFGKGGNCKSPNLTINKEWDLVGCNHGREIPYRHNFFWEHHP